MRPEFFSGFYICKNEKWGSKNGSVKGQHQKAIYEVFVFCLWQRNNLLDIQHGGHDMRWAVCGNDGQRGAFAHNAAVVDNNKSWDFPGTGRRG